MTTRKIGEMMLAAATALALVAGYAQAQAVVQDIEVGGSADKLQKTGDGSATNDQTFDGKTGPDTKASVDAGGDSEPLAQPATAGKASVETSDPKDVKDPQASTDTAKAEVPKPGDQAEFPEQEGDKAKKSTLGDSAARTTRSIGSFLPTIGAIGGLMGFLWGIATFNPYLMMGALLAGGAAILIAGLINAFVPDPDKPKT